MTRIYRNMARQPLSWRCPRCGSEVQDGKLCMYCSERGIWQVLLVALVCLMLALTFHGAKAQVEVGPEPTPIAISECSSDDVPGCYAHFVFVPSIFNAVSFIDMDTRAQDTQAKLYIPYAPYLYRSHIDYGTIFGTALCRNDNQPASRAVVYFDFIGGGGTSGTANGIGEFVILAIVGKQGRLTWNGHVLTGVLTMTTTPQNVTVHLDCVVRGDVVTG